MKITDIKTRTFYYTTTRALSDCNFPAGNSAWALTAVFVETDSELTGITIGNPNSEAYIQAIKPIVIGEDPAGVKGIWQKMNDYLFKRGTRGVAGEAMATIDTALWDLKAKMNSEPLWKTLGARERKVKLYGSDIGYGLSDDELREYYRGIAGLKISGGKLKVGLDRERDLRRIGIMKDELARVSRNPIIGIDANEYWAPNEAISRVREIESTVNLSWLEEPARRWDYRGLRKVSSAVNCAVATGENLYDVSEFTPLFLNEAVDIVEIGWWSGGITGALIVADTAYALDTPVCMMNSPGSFLGHLAAAIPNHMAMEYVGAGRTACFSTGTEIEDGMLVLSDRPGLGIEVDMEKLDELSRNAPRNRFMMPGRRIGAGLYVVAEGEAEGDR
ncbi:mandelate racemase/muconate lactonizing enzyme family protein [Marispirochaeta sp.]|uniref:mandelate racemase/muconate lactonizing enzyme family protein n=1 Tax=Marispirochaeta sp. TaxID=2038653 RepID=UPI0029C7E1B5|nr:mandelate racemase/muconate lactonizing enzyme family protein [Marispirochaeta sp.]